MKELKFVDVGEGITEGHIQRWLVKDGVQVNEDQSIVQVETDKAIVNVPSPIFGTIKIVAQENTTVHVGDTIAYIGDPAELNSIKQQQQTSKQLLPPTKEEMKGLIAQMPKEVITTPSVRKLARDLGIKLSSVPGTGPEGRILENDVRKAATQIQQPQQKVHISKFSELLEEQHGGEIERIPMSQTRKAIARNMELSWTIPRAVHMDRINATHLFNIVMKEKQRAEKMNVKLTFLPFIIKAAVAALKENTHFNSSYDHDTQEIILKKYYNIGLAAEAPDGLKVIVIKSADKKSILQIAKEIQELSEKIRNMTITLEEMSDGTFTITNIGSLGGGYLSVPMINYPEVAILGIHLITDEPIVEDNEIKIAKLLPFSLSFDHRVVDGAEAVIFGNKLKEYLEDPEFLEMLG